MIDMKAFLTRSWFAAGLLFGITPPRLGAEQNANSMACVGCHGHLGQGAGSIPAIRGQSFDHLYSTLLAYRNDQRAGTVMNRISKGYTESELVELARSFSRQD